MNKDENQEIVEMESAMLLLGVLELFLFVLTIVLFFTCGPSSLKSITSLWLLISSQLIRTILGGLGG